MGPVRLVDAIIGTAVDRLERDVLRHAGRSDPLSHCGLVPTRALTAVRTYVQSIIDHEDQIQVGVPYVFPSSRNGEMCRSSASASLRSSSFVHVVICVIFFATYGCSSVLIARRSSIAR
jgi:hypothetical protein